LSLAREVGYSSIILVYMADERRLLVMNSGRHRVDTALLTKSVGNEKIRRAAPEEVREATRQAIGGVAPVGHPAPVETVVDLTLQEYPQLWAAGGTPRTIFPTVLSELVAMTTGTVVEVN